MLAQYQAIKREHADVILLFRLGDFYEMFGEDAKLAAETLNLTLTSREIGKGRRIPMCGVPHHAVERYIARLIAAGHKAAVCDQMEDPSKARGLVKREVTRVLTPGTVVEDYLLDERRNNYLAAVVVGEGEWGVAAVDCSTGEFLVTQTARRGEGGQARHTDGGQVRHTDGGQASRAVEDALLEELSRLGPAEVLLPAALARDGTFAELLRNAAACRVTEFAEDDFGLDTPYELLTRHFGTTSLRGYGCEEMPLAIHAAGMALRYLQQNQKSALAQIRSITTYSLSQFMILDAATRRNLELTQSLRDGGRANSVLWLLDETVTSMGARLLRRWLLSPLLDPAMIRQRLEVVQALRQDALLRGSVRDMLRSIHDLERVTSRAAAGTGNARELVALRDSLARLPQLIALLAGSVSAAVRTLAEDADALPDLEQVLRAALDDDPPLGLREGGLIRPGYNPDLDALRAASAEGKDWIAALEQSERERTGIKSLKVGYNQVFGYYIEVTKPNLALAPPDYIRKQTLANAERFITPALKEYEAKVLGAREKIVELEYELFCDLRRQVASQAERLQAAAALVAKADVLATFAEIAAERGYSMPEVDEAEVIEIRAGRHPVVERTETSERFVPNDTWLDCSENQLLIITGPNMAGKSTYLRQVALIALMAQIGSFVPAERARIGIVDRIFTRVGASDDLATGQSTFMVEMNETANILHNATRRSLIILDEIGRGTSTFDGLSIAWAVAEHIHNHPRLGAKSLFATHYHHLNDLEKTLPRVKNYRVAVKEEGERIIFLRKIVPGGTDRSYGIQVARLAGLPQEVIERAKQVLWSLEQADSVGMLPRRAPAFKPPAAPQGQLTLFEALPNPLVDELKEIDLESLTPLEALNKLAELQARARAQEKPANRREHREHRDQES
jgi:DNA mismatch repair protein MutS